MFNDLTKPRQHKERNPLLWNSHGFTIATEEKYHTVTSNKLDDLSLRTIDDQAIPCIIPVQGSAELNSIMWLDLQKKLRDEDISLLIEDIDFEQKFEDDPLYYTLDSDEKAEISKPYLMTMNLIGEATNLSQEWKEGKVKLTEPRTGTKDIIVAFSYGNYILTLIESQLTKDDNDNELDETDFYEIYNY